MCLAPVLVPKRGEAVDPFLLSSRPHLNVHVVPWRPACAHDRMISPRSASWPGTRPSPQAPTVAVPGGEALSAPVCALLSTCTFPTSCCLNSAANLPDSRLERIQQHLHRLRGWVEAELTRHQGLLGHSHSSRSGESQE